MSLEVGIFSTDKKISNELYIYECGFEHCKPREPYEYEPIDYYLIHYILDGEGLFFIDNKVYHLKKGDGFFIPPNTKNNYYPITENPWTYRWIGVNGSRAKEILDKCNFNGNYTFNYVKDDLVDFHFKSIYENSIINKPFNAIGHFYQLVSLLIDECSQSDDVDSSKNKSYIDDSLIFIEKNYDKSITVSDIANHLNIDRSYFFKIFKLSLMISPQQFLIDFKLNKACDLLRKSNYSISEISELLGFSSQSYFSKLFKKNLGITPVQYRNKFIHSS
ncbi:MAG: AraC family transcriptional regulator [Clostridium sp.]|uniref:AraC family transcriptional regulator n=1 Tax=Clostridium sp. TaxID=1506 RepID=UPI003EE71891